MDHAINSPHAGRPRGLPLRWAGALVVSCRWAVEVRRRCDREVAAGRRLDGDTLRRIAREVDEFLFEQ